jgi:hypothetical protein
MGSLESKHSKPMKEAVSGACLPEIDPTILRGILHESGNNSLEGETNER